MKEGLLAVWLVQDFPNKHRVKMAKQLRSNPTKIETDGNINRVFLGEQNKKELGKMHMTEYYITKRKYGLSQEQGLMKSQNSNRRYLWKISFLRHGKVSLCFYLIFPNVISPNQVSFSQGFLPS